MKLNKTLVVLAALGMVGFAGQIFADDAGGTLTETTHVQTISGLDSISMTVGNATTVDIDVCVYSNETANGTYTIKAASTEGGSNIYKMKGPNDDLITYTLQYNDEKADGNTDIAALTENTQLSSQKVGSIPVSSTTCTEGEKALLRLNVASAALEGKQAGDYDDTLTFTVTPETV